jgi:hypothetical protein
MREKERKERECAVMDSYDVRKAIIVLILVCTGYVGLYRTFCEPPSSFFLSSSSFSLELFSGFSISPPTTSHSRKIERGRMTIFVQWASYYVHGRVELLRARYSKP